MKYYYYNLLESKSGGNFSDKMRLSDGIRFTAQRAFEPFESYLTNAIAAMEKKENIKAKWQKIKIDNLADLKIIGGLYEIPRQTIVQFSENVLDDVQIGTVVRGSENDHKIISVNGNQIVFDIVPETDEMLFWNKKTLEFSIIPSEKPNGTIIREEQNRYIVYSEKTIDKATRIQDNKLSSFIDFDDLHFENGDKLNATRNEGITVTLANVSDGGKTVISNDIKFKIEKIRKNNLDAYWIQLQELDESEADDVPGYSPLRYFFDDDVDIEDERGNKYVVAAGIETENKIVLKRQAESKQNRFFWEHCFPESPVLKVKVNTYQLRKQAEAIASLLKMPVGEQSKLIKLFENRERTEWTAPDNKRIDEWFVITDEDRSGCSEQRKFVRQAINTPDFAILEGPPGSGKTTVILELICQLAKQGKRVLLCGSTHVAIDNVLERLKESRSGQSLLEKFNILPVRIGDEKRINEDIREFQINNLIADNGLSETLLLDAANLVCGTTIGILQHPKFKQRRGAMRPDDRGKMQYFSAEPIVPEFDYLIIDESSKTTFQEFLVPALYAKKWILAGDVMQLSPFTEREEIVSNIEQLQIDGKTLPYELQQAVFYLQKLKECSRNKQNKFVLPVNSEIATYIAGELLAGRIEDFQHKIIYFLSDDDNADKDCLHKRNIKNVSKLELSAADLIIIEENLMEKNIHLIPEIHAVLRSKSKWYESEHAFIHNVYQQQNEFQYKERGREYNNSFDIVQSLNSYFVEKNWAEEIAWRVDREHQLRMIEKSKIRSNYSNAILELMPKTLDSEQVEGQINLIASMAFPSILESLVKGISGRKLKIESTISQGFSSYDLAKRKTTLIYQHRMHPDISRFPRERFYKSEDALLDLEQPRSIETMREWEYDKYPKRNVWIDVQGKTVKNYNLQEVDVLIKHLKEFLEFAKNAHQPEGKEWTVACLTFYRGQETHIREKLQQLSGNENGFSNFNIINGKHRINIKLHTVDKFQGHEADIVFLSMVQTTRDGFMDNPNRLNVAITRAKFQLVIIGNHDYFCHKSNSDDLRELAINTHKHNAR